MNIAFVVFQNIKAVTKWRAVILLPVFLIIQLTGSSTDFGTPPTGLLFASPNNQTVSPINKYSHTSQTNKPLKYFRDGVTVPTLDVTLFKSSGVAAFTPTDSVRINFSDFYNNSIDTGDIVKTVFGQSNLSVLKYGIELAAEKRTKLLVTDSIIFKLSNVQTAYYRLAIDPSVLADPQRQAFIKDNYLQTETAVSLTAVTNIDFTVTADAASAAGNRFYIFFRPRVVAGALPVNFIYMQATMNENKTNIVSWKVAIEVNLHHYETEKSVDGVSFKRFGGDVFSTGNGNAATYEQKDVTPATGTVFYRVKAIVTTGLWAYSNIVKLKFTDKYSPIQVNPNPVTNKTVNVVFNDRAGIYNYFVVSREGKMIVKGQLKVAKNVQTKTITLNAGTTTGIYDLVLTDEDGNRKTITITVW